VGILALPLGGTRGAFGGVRGPINCQNHANESFIQNERGTYEWKTAVCAPADLGLVHVDEDPWVTERATSSIARHGALVCPANRLLVNEFDRGVWAGLIMSSRQQILHNLYHSSAHISPIHPNSPSHPQNSNPTYLILHNTLLKPRPTHGNLPGLLTPAPNALVIRRLLRPHALSIRHIFLQHLVERALGRRGQRIGLGDVGLDGALDGVVGGHLVRGRGGGHVAEGSPEGAGCAECADEHGGLGGEGQWLG
jgi:hypothetical protein